MAAPNDTKAQIEEIVGAIQIKENENFRTIWLKNQNVTTLYSKDINGNIFEKIDKTDKKTLINAIGKLIYDSFYTNKDTSKEHKKATGNFIDNLRKIVFIDRPNIYNDPDNGNFRNLVSLNPSKGWIVNKVELNGNITASKSSFRKRMEVGSYLQEVPLNKLSEGSAVYQPPILGYEEEDKGGYLWTFGLTRNDYFAPNRTIRFYFNIIPEGASNLIKLICYYFDINQIPFQLKVFKSLNRKTGSSINPVDSFPYQRADSAVLYLDSTHYQIALNIILIDILPDINQFLHDKTPLFTLPLSEIFQLNNVKGVSFAENPYESSNESFGENRSKLIANGIFRSLQDNGYADTAKVLEYITNEGYDLDRFYLNPNSNLKVTFDGASYDLIDRNIGYALTIAYKLLGNAIRYEDTSNWIGVDSRNGRTIHRALDSSLANGTTGIALFLSNVFKQNLKLKTIEDAALSAISHALAYNYPSNTGCYGLYNGYAGVLYGFLKSFENMEFIKDGNMEDENWRNKLDTIINKILALPPPSLRENDINSGIAGSIIALIFVLKKLPGYNLNSQIQSKIIELKDILVTRAEWQSGQICSWKTTEIASRNHIGMNGTSGIALAFIELASFTTEDTVKVECLRHILGAFRYENSPQNISPLGNWVNVVQSGLLVNWQYGAAGIGLARIRALQIFTDDTILNICQQDIIKAIEKTYEVLETKALPATDFNNFSFSTGILGCLDFLMEACSEPKMVDFFSNNDWKKNINDLTMAIIEGEQKEKSNYKRNFDNTGNFIENYLKLEIPFRNGKKNKDKQSNQADVSMLYCPDLMNGFAGVGYSLMRSRLEIDSVTLIKT